MSMTWVSMCAKLMHQFLSLLQTRWKGFGIRYYQCCIGGGLLFAIPPLMASTAPLGFSERAPPGWVAGFAAVEGPNPFIGDADTVSPIYPIVGYIGENIIWMGPYLNYKLLRGKTLPFFLAGTVNYRFEGFDEDSNSPLLAGMEGRDGAFELGLEFRFAALFMSAAMDITNTHNGYEIQLGADHVFELSNRASIGGVVGVSMKNHELVDYYYGVRAGEATLGRPAYLGDSALNMNLGLNFSYDFGNQWRGSASFKHEWLSDEITRSPIVERDFQTTFFFGLLYQFER